MSVDTLGFPRRRVTPQEVLGFIRATYDKEAKLEPLVSSSSTIDKEGVVYFKFSEAEQRALWIFFHRAGSEDGYDVPHPKAPYTVFDLGYWGHSVEIVSELLAATGGGYIMPQDCDSDIYRYIEPSPNAYETYKDEIPRIVTMEDIKKAFGENIILNLKEEK